MTSFESNGRDTYVAITLNERPAGYVTEDAWFEIQSLMRTVKILVEQLEAATAIEIDPKYARPVERIGT